jgi:hypothetical protein
MYVCIRALVWYSHTHIYVFVCIYIGSNDEKKRFQKSILLYFNKSLDKLLLYDKERAQVCHACSEYVAHILSHMRL